MGHERPMYDPIGIGPLQGSRRESTFVQREEGCGENLGYARLVSRHHWRASFGFAPGRSACVNVKVCLWDFYPVIRRTH